MRFNRAVAIFVSVLASTLRLTSCASTGSSTVAVFTAVHAASAGSLASDAAVLTQRLRVGMRSELVRGKDVCIRNL
jgi:hypothetical protein